MKSISFLFVLIFTTVLFAGNSFDDKNEMQRLGITGKEWQLYKESGMSKHKLQKLLSAGITLGEYFKEPWKKLGISSNEWIRLRRSGLGNQEIKQMHEKKELGNGNVVLAFFLPGIGHFKLNQKQKGYTLAGIAIGSTALYFTHKKNWRENSKIVPKRQPIYLGILLIDCLLSAGDIWRQTRYEDNPDMQRFSLRTDLKSVNINANFKF